MDKIIELAKDLAHEIQMDERFIRTQLAQAAADEDKELQCLIGDFNLKRMALNNETQKDPADRDAAKLQLLDKELREVYAQVMANGNMIRYNEAKTGLDELMNAVTRILTLAAQGVDPDDADSASCTGSCATCPGCH